MSFCSTKKNSRFITGLPTSCSYTEQKKHSVNLGNTTKEVYENLRPLGIVYQTFLDTTEFTRFDQIHTALWKIYGGEYPLRQIIDDVTVKAGDKQKYIPFICKIRLCFQIAPKCSDLIQHCVWRGRVVNCSQYVQERHSFVGKCCYFNYHRPAKQSVL